MCINIRYIIAPLANGNFIFRCLSATVTCQSRGSLAFLHSINISLNKSLKISEYRRGSAPRAHLLISHAISVPNLGRQRWNSAENRPRLSKIDRVPPSLSSFAINDTRPSERFIRPTTCRDFSTRPRGCSRVSGSEYTQNRGTECGSD